MESSCRHCGSPVPAGREDAFCCAGCAYVFDLLHSEGLAHFYDLKGSTALPPVSVQGLRERDYDWLSHLATEAESAEGRSRAELRLSVQGMSCVGCVWLLEKVFSKHPGALTICVDVVQGELDLTWEPGQFDMVAFAREVQAFGYLLGPRNADAAPVESSGLARRTGTCGAFAMNAMAFSLPAYFGMPRDFPFARLFDLVAVMSATLAMLVGGSYFISRSWRSLRMGALHIDTPIALGIIAAYAGSMVGWLMNEEGLKYFDFVAIFIFLMLGGRWLQQAAVERNRRKLMRDTSIPERVTVLADGSGEASEVRVTELTPGSRIRIKPAQTVPVAARLDTAHAAVSLEWINGESEPVERAQGQLLPAGALNISSTEIEAEALESWEESTLRKLLEARRGQDARDLRLERVLRVYLALVVAAGVLGALGWWWAGAGIERALQIMISIFVVSCPCALGVAVPLAEELAALRAQRLGVFVRTLGFWKKVGRVHQVVFDKTGTLTLENPTLKNPEVVQSLPAEARSALRRLVEGNLHPVSRSLYDQVGPGDRLDGEVSEKIGQGLSLRSGEGRVWTLGRPADAESADAELRLNGALIAGFAFTDSLRPETATEFAELKRRRIAVRLLSGDRQEKVEKIAQTLGLSPGDWQAGLTPAAKAKWVADHSGAATLYIGDGANDSLAFDEACCAGSPITGRSFLEQKADFFFLGHNLRFVSRLMDVARTHQRAVRRVFFLSTSYNLITVIAGLAGMLSPLGAAVLMPLSSIATLSLVGWTFRADRVREASHLTKNGPLPKGLEAALPSQ